jgi:hypothetical protein
MTHGHPLWFWLVWACVLWYSTVTLYVGIKGAVDIRQMLRGLKARGKEAPPDNPPGPGGARDTGHEATLPGSEPGNRNPSHE